MKAPDLTLSFGSQLNTGTVSWNGPYLVLLAMRPRYGATVPVPGLSGWIVGKVNIVRRGGGMATMTADVSAPATGSAAFQRPDYDVQWQRVEKPLATHPRYAGVPNVVLNKIEEYFGTTDPAERATIYAEIGELEFGELGQEIVHKRLRGTDTWTPYAPVVTKTSVSSRSPETGGCGHRQSPPRAAGAPTGYEWVKTADGKRKAGTASTWTREEEWTGAEAVDEDLYPRTRT